MVRLAEIEPLDRGSGVRTLPYVGRWNASANGLTSGVTIFAPGTGLRSTPTTSRKLF